MILRALLASTLLFSPLLHANSEEGVLDPADARNICRRFTQSAVKRPGQRPVFAKMHGCARATFTVLEGLAMPGLFAKSETYQAWVRFSSDTVARSSDFDKFTTGFAVKVLNVPDKPKVLPGEENDPHHDFVLQNHPVFFSDNARDFMEFNEAAFTTGLEPYWAQSPRHGKLKDVFNAMNKDTSNVLEEHYFSTLPYRLGQGYAKYKVIPCVGLPREPMPADGDVHFLRTRLERDMKNKNACFQLQVQRRTHPNEMPLDQASREWSEDLSKPVTVAVIQVQSQEVGANAAVCEGMSFTGWHAYKEHEPVGTLNQARAVVYKSLADLRRVHNGVPPPDQCEH